MIRLAARAGIVLFLDPIETGGWLGVLRHNGVAKARAYGRFLGQRYKSFPNIVWSNGNDFHTWKNRSDDALVLAVAKGIRSVDSAHIQTVELDPRPTSSRDDPRWRSVIELDAAYSYVATYGVVLRAYNRKPPMPVYMAEASYEFEKTSRISRATPVILRRQAYWSMLSGAAGQFYGNGYTWPFRDGWKDHLDTPGSAQIGHLVKLFGADAMVPARARPNAQGRHRRVWNLRSGYERRARATMSPPRRHRTASSPFPTCRSEARSSSTWHASPAAFRHGGTTRRTGRTGRCRARRSGTRARSA